jgi:hypothetical protein
MGIDVAYLDRLTQRIVRSPTGLSATIETLDGATVVDSYQLSNLVAGQLPGEVADIMAAILVRLASSSSDSGPSKASLVHAAEHAAMGITTVCTWSTKPTAAGNSGMCIRVTDVGQSAGGSYWISDGTYWRPINGSVVLSRQSGSIATPIATLAGVTSGMFVPAIPVVIPAGMMVPGLCQLRVEAAFRRTGATATATLNVHLGTNKTSGDNVAYAFTYSATTLLDIIAAPTILISETSRFTGLGWQVQGGSGNASVFNDKTTAFSTAADTGITFSISGANVADSFAMIGYKVELSQ